MESRRFKERLGDFDRALSRLTEGLTLDSDSSIVIDGCIQRFEFSYELSWNTMKAYLEYQGLLDPRTPRDVIRETYRIGLIEDGDAWLDMMADRNLTSHVYDEIMARDIYDKIRNKHWRSLTALLERLKEVSAE